VLIKKLISGLLVIIFLFQCSNNNWASESEKNWCYGQYTRFINSFQIVYSGGYVFEVYDSEETINFAKQFITNDQSARTLFQDKNGEFDQFTIEEIEEVVNSYDYDLDLSNEGTLFLIVIDITRNRLLEEDGEMLELCKIFYEVST